ncbi:MAG: hypothetical protein M3Y58_17780 [Chloroflexota bacterium]|nr:hypothetical protein [Chloroflexota bacterium]
MSRICTVCASPNREAIDQALIAGEPVRSVASRYVTIGRMAVQRHKDEHLPATLAKAHEAGEVAHADDLLQQVRQLRGKAISILLQAERAGDLKTALMGVREARACVELLAEMEGELNRNPVVNVILSPEWTRLRAVIIGALAPYPDARLAIAARLVDVEGGQ